MQRTFQYFINGNEAVCLWLLLRMCGHIKSLADTNKGTPVMTYGVELWITCKNGERMLERMEQNV